MRKKRKKATSRSQRDLRKIMLDLAVIYENSLYHEHPQQLAFFKRKKNLIMDHSDWQQMRVFSSFSDYKKKFFKEALVKNG
jgi:hypothetical protein